MVHMVQANLRVFLRFEWMGWNVFDNYGTSVLNLNE